MVVQTLFWIALPGLVYGLLAACLPSSGPPPRWRTVLRRLTDRAQASWRHRHPSVPPEPDPFTVLSLQVRLGIVAAQLHALEDDTTAWARARRIQATRAAYDDLLAEACRLAGVETPATTRRPGRDDEPERFREEIELAARGWSW